MLLVPSHFYSGNFIFLDRQSIPFGKSYGLSHQIPLGYVRHEVTDGSFRTYVWPSQELQASPAKRLCSGHQEFHDVEEKTQERNLKDLDSSSGSKSFQLCDHNSVT